LGHVRCFKRAGLRVSILCLVMLQAAQRKRKKQEAAAAAGSGLAAGGGGGALTAAQPPRRSGAAAAAAGGRAAVHAAGGSPQEDGEAGGAGRKKKAKKEYIPQLHSAPFAFLIVMLQVGPEGAAAGCGYPITCLNLVSTIPACGWLQQLRGYLHMLDCMVELSLGDPQGQHCGTAGAGRRQC
jgi:hypothetical protein